MSEPSTEGQFTAEERVKIRRLLIVANGLTPDAVKEMSRLTESSRVVRASSVFIGKFIAAIGGLAIAATALKQWLFKGG